MGSLIIAGAIAAVIIVTVAMGVRTVPQGYRHIVQRFGKYHTTLNPGLNIIVPYIDQIAYKVTTKDIVLDIPSQEVITKDNATITANAVAYINILDPQKAVFGVEDYERAIKTLVQTSLRSIIGEMTLDESLSSRELIKIKLKESISNDIVDWGIALKTVEIQDINPSETMQTSMEKEAAAERERRATVTMAEGEKAATILEAEGRLEASRKDADAAIVLAEASKQAIQKVTEGIGGQELPAMYLLGEKYITAMEALSTSENAKTVVLPADIQKTVQGLLNR
ncbi:MAG: hypothetical protein CSA61_01665 [Neptuniibacter caesariensis]|uniref:Band 7 domain-containing protein n=1 Tax=Neptuniibacter caesariensis TaxID=207954 RepID=A0A2G6JB23_NEPCE|nr:MAG: hypothetical protein CSA61_01665 [Neptuniibacter caesariensis]